jgi:hypothetical protein
MPRPGEHFDLAMLPEPLQEPLRRFDGWRIVGMQEWSRKIGTSQGRAYIQLAGPRLGDSARLHIRLTVEEAVVAEETELLLEW